MAAAGTWNGPQRETGFVFRMALYVNVEHIVGAYAANVNFGSID
jgi:hypothetical protein